MSLPGLSPLDPDRDYVSGDISSEAVLVMYGDYTCPHTRNAQNLDLRLSETLASQAVFVYRQCPIPERGAAADTAARFALAAGLQGKFWDAHSALFAVDPDMPQSGLDALAQDLQLDAEKLSRDMRSDEVTAHLEKDYRAAQAADVQETPALFINGAHYVGAWDELSIIEEVERPLGVRLRSASEHFFHWAASAGLVLILATIAALMFVNVGFHDVYERLRDTEIGISVGDTGFSLSLQTWVNDGLMAIFFLIVGIEIKREVNDGELSSLSKAILPIVGAVGGILAPVVIYLVFNAGLDSAGGWGVPMATDIAFTLGIIALLGPRVPLPLKVFVSALAIADDLGAILVIAVFYGHGFHVEPALWALAVLAVMLLLNRSRIYSRTPYLLLGLLLWFAVHESGLHATLAGVLTAVMIPSRKSGNVAGVAAQTAAILSAQKGSELGGEPLRILQNAVERLREPGYHLQHKLEGWSNFLILPLFAFFNTGIVLSGGGFSIASPVNLGVILGLVIGKPLGILLACWLAVRLGFASLATGVTWTQMAGAGCLAGVGFTMSIFIATSAFHGDILNSVKLSVLIGSVLAAVIGSMVLLRQPTEK